MLNMSVENIRKLVGQQITYENWHNNFTTNCYAFAMGFDVSEEDICYHAYGLGYISSNILGTKPWNFRTAKGAERQLLYDFKSLGLTWKSSTDRERFLIPRPIEQEENSWDILFFIKDYERRFDIHFARVDKDGVISHKPGWILYPRPTTVEDIEKSNYQFVKHYHLTLNGK